MFERIDAILAEVFDDAGIDAISHGLAEPREFAVELYRCGRVGGTGGLRGLKKTEIDRSSEMDGGTIFAALVEKDPPRKTIRSNATGVPGVFGDRAYPKIGAAIVERIAVLVIDNEPGWRAQYSPRETKAPLLRLVR